MITKLINNDCLEALKELPDNSIDVIITDPPYQLDSISKRFKNVKENQKIMKDLSTKPEIYQRHAKGFMGKEWDVLPSVEIWKECLRVLKPASFAFIMCTPRQDSLMKMYNNLSESGFNIGFTSLYWCYASGFPKAKDISKGIDNKKGLEREVYKIKYTKNSKSGSYDDRPWLDEARAKGYKDMPNDIPACEESEKFDGWKGGFQPKPAIEIIIVVQKPMSEKTFVDQALSSLENDNVGKGCINIDACRIPFSNGKDKENACSERPNAENHNINKDVFNSFKSPITRADQKGRFPANLLVSDNVLDEGKTRKSGEKKDTHNVNYNKENHFSFTIKREKWDNYPSLENDFSRYFDLDIWFSEGIKRLPKNVQKNFPCLIVNKPTKAEKNVGCYELNGNQHNTGSRTYDDRCAVCGKKLVGDDPYRCKCENKITEKRITKGNFHPTVKPVKLMMYLIELSTFKNDVVLDPFMGSGTTGIGCKLLDRNFIGIERDSEYIKISESRINNAHKIITSRMTLEDKETKEQLELF